MIFNPPELWYRSPPEIKQKDLPYSDRSIGAFIGNGVFILVKYNIFSTSTIAVSHDEGNSWEYVTIKEGYKAVITFQNGFFFALLHKGDEISDYYLYEPVSFIARSTDGINWEETTPPITGNFYAPIYGNGVYVCLPGDNQYKTSPNGNNLYTNRLIYSYDGLNWKLGNTFPIQHSSQKSRALRAVFTGTSFVAFNYYSPGEAMRSEDGLTWNLVVIPEDEYRIGPIVCGDVIVTASYKSGTFYRSDDDGRTWIISGTFPIIDESLCRYGGNFYDGKHLITVRYSNLEGGGNIYSSEDYGASWELVANPFSDMISNNITGTYYDGRWVVAANNYDTYGYPSFIVYSDDFVNWHTMKAPYPLNFHNFAVKNGKMLIADFSRQSKAVIVELN